MPSRQRNETENPIVQDMIARGLQLDPNLTDEQFLQVMAQDSQRIQQQAAQLKQFEQMQPLLREFQEMQPQFQQYLQSRGAEPQQQAPQPQGVASLPQYDPQWERYTKWDPDRNEYVPDGPYASAQAAIDRNRYHQALQNRQRQLLEDPVSFLWQNGFEQRFNEAVEERAQQIRQELQSSVGQVQQKTEFTRFIDKNFDRLFVVDPQTGRPQLDANGAPVLTELGRVYEEAEQYAANTLELSEDRAHQHAMRELQRYEQQSLSRPQGDPKGSQAPRSTGSRPQESARQAGGHAPNDAGLEAFGEDDEGDHQFLEDLQSASVASASRAADSASDGISWQEALQLGQDEIAARGDFD